RHLSCSTSLRLKKCFPSEGRSRQRRIRRRDGALKGVGDQSPKEEEKRLQDERVVPEAKEGGRNDDATVQHRRIVGFVRRIGSSDSRY
ncbi:hypothetical protein BHE74_00030799, partial [Ensete ventricosum]